MYNNRGFLFFFVSSFSFFLLVSFLRSTKYNINGIICTVMKALPERLGGLAVFVVNMFVFKI